MRKTKIVCTLGPATDDEAVLRGMMEAGMDVARLNFSHGSHAEHQVRVDMVKRLRREMGRPIALMIDTKGPDIRVGRFKDGFVELRAGDTFTLCGEMVEGDSAKVGITFPGLSCRLKAGDAVMLDDGLMELRVVETTARDTVCKIISGGVLASNKSVNVPGVKLDIPYMREKDIEDLRFAVAHDFDYVAASFVRSAQDVREVRQVLEEGGAHGIRIISKIENSEGIENIDEILRDSDSIMVARGDMGVELPFEDLPGIQKMLIKKAMEHGKISITATQMLESMMKNPRPTRAEVSDVANAIFDGTSAIMLSGETSVGRYPVETVGTMARIAAVTEASIDYEKRFNQLGWEVPAEGITDAICHSVCSAAYRIKARTIFTLTQKGGTGYGVSRYRPASGYLGFTPDEKVYHQLSLSWGCTPMLQESRDSLDALVQSARQMAKEAGLVQEGDKVVFTAGLPLGCSGLTNMVQAITI